MNQMKIYLRWVEQEKKRYAIIYDHDHHIVSAATEYFIYLLDQRQLSQNTVNQITWNIKQWYQFLSKVRVDFVDVSDVLLEAYRNYLTNIRSPNSSMNLATTKRTVNASLRSIYDYYYYLEMYVFTEVRFMGAKNSPICSELGAKVTRDRKYPLCYRRVGEGSKHRVSFVPTEKHREQLRAYFYDTHSSSVASRNCLIMDIAWELGWRRASILSLRCSQFSNNVLASAEDADEDWVNIVPEEQKYGYQNIFRVPLSLSWRIWRYIEEDRSEILYSIKRSVLTISDYLFVNVRNGKKISKESISVAFFRAAKDLSWPRGAGLHSWRRAFANNELEFELDARRELNFDTSMESLGLSLAQKLGHANVGSQQAYVRDVQRRMKDTDVCRQRNEIRRLESENARLTEELAKSVKAR